MIAPYGCYYPPIDDYRDFLPIPKHGLREPHAFVASIVSPRNEFPRTRAIRIASNGPKICLLLCSSRATTDSIID